MTNWSLWIQSFHKYDEMKNKHYHSPDEKSITLDEILLEDDNIED